VPAWNFATLVDAIARATPDREVVVQGARRITWQQLASRARSFAWYLHTEGGLAPGDKVAIVLPNCPEYVETFLATRKLHGVPLGMALGSGADALHAMIDASDAKAVVCSPAMARTVHTAIRRIPKRWRPTVVEVGPLYERGIAGATPPSEWEIEVPSADDLIAIATHDVSSGSTATGVTLLPASPLAQGDGFAEVLKVLSSRGRVVFVDSPVFDPRLVWQAVAQEGVATLTIGGDAFARPLLAALPAATGGHPLTTLRTISSPGAPLSRDVAIALQAALPGVTILDRSEAPEQRAGDAERKIDPADVEAGLRKHRSISDCVVVGISDPRVGKAVVAVIEISEGHYLDAPELAAWCRAHLPSTMTPGRFVFVEKIVRSPSGEPDYQGLRGLAIDQLSTDQ
jgi:3-oxocholest-4-en-26-oate---CoA ligase